MKVPENAFFRRFHVGPFTDEILEKTNSYAREVPTRIFQENFHKQIKTARSPPRNGP